MNYLDYINSIPMYQMGGSTTNPWKELAKDITPGLGTYRAFKEAKANPSFKSYANAGLSAVGDLALLTGVGAGIKGLSALNKAGKVAKAANTVKGTRAFNTTMNAANAALRNSDLYTDVAKIAGPVGVDEKFGRWVEGINEMQK